MDSITYSRQRFNALLRKADTLLIAAQALSEAGEEKATDKLLDLIDDIHAQKRLMLQDLERRVSARLQPMNAQKSARLIGVAA